VTDSWLQALRGQAETLLRVDLSHCQAVTDMGVLQLLHASRLRSLCIDMCLQVPIAPCLAPSCCPSCSVGAQ